MNFATMKLISALPFLFPLFALAIESFDRTQHESSSTSEGSGQKKRDLLSIVCPNPPCEVPTASIVGRAFFDTNGDGIDNDPDNAIAGVTVRLEDPTSQLIATTLTGSDGSYSFGNRSGNFVIRPDIRGLITIFKGFEEGGNDIDPITGLSEQFIVFSSDETINIGVVALIATLPPPFVATFAPTPSPTPEPTEDPCFFRSDDNLLCNGSFELNAVPSGELIRFPEDQVPGWNSLGDIICLNNNVGNVQAADGTKYAELDCIAGGSIEGLYQDVVTVPGVEYTLSFKMRSRDPNKAFTEDEGVNVSRLLFIFLKFISSSSHLGCTKPKISPFCFRHHAGRVEWKQDHSYQHLGSNSKLGTKGIHGDRYRFRPNPLPRIHCQLWE